MASRKIVKTKHATDRGGTRVLPMDKELPRGTGRQTTITYHKQRLYIDETAWNQGAAVYWKNL